MSGIDIDPETSAVIGSTRESTKMEDSKNSSIHVFSKHLQNPLPLAPQSQKNWILADNHENKQKNEKELK
jgi:hypothetical protein